MKILSMTASFGKLQNARLELGGGLNLIVAPNEGGKSTWCAFLRAMLYGIPTNQRDKQGYIAEKNRYQPWNGGGMEGTMTLVWGDREITLRRGPRGSTPFGGFSAVYAGTEEPVPGLTGENCGERLLGVSREVYERSAFVGQGGAAIGPNGELEKRIAALVSSGEEEVSYSQVAKTLREWQNRRRHNATGIIPKLQNELAVLRDTLARQAQTCNQAEDAKRELDLLTLRQKELSADAETHRGLANEARREKYEAAAADLRAAELAADALTADLGQAPDTETLRDAQGALAYLRTIEVNLKLARRQEEEAVQTADTRRALAQDPLFSGMTDEEAREQAAADGAQVDANRTRAAREARWRWLTAGIALLFLAAVAAAGWFLLPAMRTAVVGSCIGAFLGCAAVGIAVGSVKAKKHGAAADGILKRYGAENTPELFLLANAYCLRYRDAEDADRRAADAAAARERLEQEGRETFRSLLELVRGFEPKVTDVFGISAALSRALGLRERLSTANMRLEGARRLVESLPTPGDARVPPGTKAPENGPTETAAALAATEGELARLKNALAMAQGELNTLGDPVLFLSRSEALEEQLLRRREEYEALALALDSLEAAHADLQARFSPALNGEAGGILSALTGGKYSRLALTRDFEALAEEGDSPLPRRTILLSQGTAEQVYLAVRLAVCKLALPAEDPAPLVLDDVLDSFDDGRMALALDCLQDLAGTRQILLFSCHSREETVLAAGGKARIISL